MLKKGLIVFSLLTAVFMILMVIQKKRQEIRNEQYRADYPRAIKEYLKDKYGKNFYVNPDYHFYSGSPIPASNTRSPYMFEVWEKENDGYVFNVWIDTVSFEDDQIEEIQDNYCWKFLSIMMKEWFQEEMADILPKEYKLIFVESTSSIMDERITPNSPLAYYFEIRETPDYLYLYLILPPGSSYEEDGLTEENVTQVIREFYQKYPKVRIRFFVEQTKDTEDYQRINVRKEENLQFYLGKRSDKNPFLDVELDSKMDIELELED